MKTLGQDCAPDFQPMCPGAECETDGIGRSVAQRRANKTIGFTQGDFRQKKGALTPLVQKVID